MTRYATFLNPALVDREGLIKPLSRLFSSGVATAFDANAWKVVQRGAGANQSVDVSVGDGFLLLPNNAFGYWGWTDAVENVPATAANATNPRYDTVVAWIDTTVTSTVNANSPGALKFSIYAGTAAGSPTALNDASIQSSVGAGVAWLRLADILRPAAVNNITTGNITDKRVDITGLVYAAIADSAVTTAKVNNGAITPEKLSTGAGASWAWQTWTPTLANFTIGTGGSAGVTAKYIRIGKTIFYNIKATLGSSGQSVGSNASFTLPVAATFNAGAPVGSIYASISGTTHPGQVQLSTSTVALVDFYLDDAGTASQYVARTTTANNIPGTWLAGDYFNATGFYEAA